MFETETNRIRESITLLNTLLEKDVRETDPGVTDELLLSFRHELLELASNLRHQIPYESLDDNEELTEELGEEHLDDAEVEDEVVEVDRAIDELLVAMGKFDAMYYPDGVPAYEEEMAGNPELLHQKKIYSADEYDEYLKDKYHLVDRKLTFKSWMMSYWPLILLILMFAFIIAITLDAF